MKSLWMRLSALVIALFLASPMIAAEEKKADDGRIPSKGVIEGPIGSGSKSYRERVNRVSRRTLRKDAPTDYQIVEDAEGNKVRRRSPVVARKTTKVRRTRVTRWEHTLQTARGPIRGR